MGTVTLTGEGLSCQRGGRTVLEGIDFSVSSGEVLALRGANGAGKSTLLRLVAGLLQPESGVLTLKPDAQDTTLGERAHYLGHLDALKPALSVEDNLRFWARYLGGNSDAVSHALETVGLIDLSHLPARVLSAGQKRRLALARLAAVPRPVWLLDEPTSALDGASQDRLFAMIGDHLNGGGLAVIATHVDLPLKAKTLDLGNKNSRDAA